MPRRGGVGFGGAYPFAAPHSGDPGGPHQSGDLIPAEVVTSPAGGFPQLAGTVDPVVVFPELPKYRAIIWASRWARADGARVLTA